MPLCTPGSSSANVPAARLHLSFERNGSGATILRCKRQDPPWRVVRGFPSPYGETLAHLHNVSGGILGGDSLECRIDLAPGAQAQITTTGATRIYRTKPAARVSSQHAFISIGEEGYLEYVPDPVIPFAGSRFEQSAHLDLKHGASVVWWDMVSPGREACGEVFQYESLGASFDLTACGEPVAIERWAIAPAERTPAVLVRLGPFRHFASCYVCRAGTSLAYWRNIETELQPLTDQLSNSEVLWGVSPLAAHGIAFRGVSATGRSLSDGLIQIWKAAKWLLCGRVATLPRKVH